MSVLLVRPSTADASHRALDAVVRRFPGEPIVLFVKGEVDAPRVFRGASVEVVRKPDRLGVRAALRLRSGLRRRPWSAVVLPLAGTPPAPAPLGRLLFFASVGGARALTLDESGAFRRLRLVDAAREACRGALLAVLDGAARLGARALVAAFAPSAPAATGRASRAARPRIAVVLPVLPDLSHTFVYREVLALLDGRGVDDVVALVEGDRALVHPEAARLLPRTRFVRAEGVVARYARLLAWGMRAPRRTASLFALYARRPGGSVRDLLGRRALEEARHPARAFALADALRDAGAGRIHCYGSTYPANAAMGAALLLGIPFTVTAYEDFDFEYDYKMLGEKYRLAAFFRATTEASRARLAGALGVAAPDRIAVVPWGIDRDAWTAEARASGEGRLVSACRLVEKKGLAHLVPALARLRRAGRPFRWVVAGEGPERPALEALVRAHGLDDRVEFLGAVPNDRVRTLLSSADAAVLPCVVARDGDRDGIPTFVVEAMLAGVPVVTSPVSGIPELVVDGETGFLVEPGNPESLARAIEGVLADPGRAREVALRGRARAEATLDVRESARRMRALLESDGAPAAA